MNLPSSNMPNMPMAPTPDPSASSSKKMMYLFIVAVIVILALAGWYISSMRPGETPPPAIDSTQTTEEFEIMNEAAPVIESLEEVTPGTGLSSIGQDLDETNLEALELELEALEQQFQ